MKQKDFFDVHDVSAYLEVSIPQAYKVMQRLNRELSDRGYLTIAGRISRPYFEERVYGTAHRWEEVHHE